MSRLALLSFLVSCTAVDGKEDGTRVDLDTAEPESACALGEVLEVVPLDIWGQDLDTLELGTDVDTIPASALGPAAVWIPVEDADSVVNLTLSAPDYIDAIAQVRHRGDGVFELTGISDEVRYAQSSRVESVEGELCNVSTVYLGIDHAWFASTARPPSLNHATFLYDQENFWSAVHKELLGARRSVTWSTWWWESNFELTRPLGDHVDMPEYERWNNTILGIMSSLDGADRRVLVNRFWDDNLDFNVYVSADADLLERAETTGDGFEFMLQGNATEVPITGTYDAEPADFDFSARVAKNPRYSEREITGEVPVSAIDLELQVASWHQKGVVIDGDVAFIGGMNTKGVDWDTEDHFIFEPRRMAYEATEDDRREVEAKLAYPTNIPRRDYGMKIEGPAAWDADDIFRERWQYGIENNDAYSEYTTELVLQDRPADVTGGVPAQTTATMSAPWMEMSILETQAKAISQAERYIFIEDQYFRAPILLDEVIAVMTAKPDLLLTVVTMDVSWYDGGKKYTYLADSKLRELFPDRYQLLVLKTVDLTVDDGWVWDEVTYHQQSILTHSKLRIIDDRYLSVGSCNFNNRGYKYEGELNVSVLDETTAIAARRHVYQNLVGPTWWGYLSDDPENNFAVFEAAAESNQELSDWWEENASLIDADEAYEWWPEFRPSGFVYPLQMDNDWEWDVGPDLF
jgi:phosphatidylserine/phosphatidylglycerophosphate/cardiolipin synthase-like enzyme